VDVEIAFAQATNAMDEESFQALYGRWEPLEPAQVAELLQASPLRWWIAGGRAARVGAIARHHDDVDVVVRLGDLDQLRKALARWHLWENRSGTLRPLLPGFALTEGTEQLWARLNSGQPWQLDLLLDPSDGEWVYKHDPEIRLPWPRALHNVDGIPHLRPEVALLYKARFDRPKDRADLAAARLDPGAREWLASTCEQLGHHTWAPLVRAGGAAAAV
jgi:hypothetical protein